WVNGVDYPHKDERATVTGKIILNDPQAPGLKMKNLLVGLTAPDYEPAVVPRPPRAGAGGRRGAGGGGGGFGLAGGGDDEAAMTNLTVNAGKKLSLGKLSSQPVSYGKQLWDIGIPNRKASEFIKGDEYFHWGWYLQYPKLFPLDINYVVGKSDFRKDWFFEQV